MRSTAACSSSPSFRSCFSTVDRFVIPKSIILCFIDSPNLGLLFTSPPPPPPPPEFVFFCFLSSAPRRFFLFLIPHAVQSDCVRKTKQYTSDQIGSDQTIKWSNSVRFNCSDLWTGGTTTPKRSFARTTIGASLLLVTTSPVLFDRITSSSLHCFRIFLKTRRSTISFNNGSSPETEIGKSRSLTSSLWSSISPLPLTGILRVWDWSRLFEKQKIRNFKKAAGECRERDFF